MLVEVKSYPKGILGTLEKKPKPFSRSELLKAFEYNVCCLSWWLCAGEMLSILTFLCGVPYFFCENKISISICSMSREWNQGKAIASEGRGPCSRQGSCGRPFLYLTEQGQGTRDQPRQQTAIRVPAAGSWVSRAPLVC